MRTMIILLAAGALSAAPARAAERLTDRDVKSLAEKIEQGREHFEDALDDSVKHAVIRSATGEIDMKRVLEDFDKAIETLKDRLKPEYSGSTEAAAVLRRATGLDETLRAQSPAKGMSEWNQLAGDLKTLAAAYGAEFPLPQGAPVRRIGDRELVQAAEKLAATGEQVRKSLDNELKKDKTVDEQTRKSLVAQAEEWTRAAKTLRDRVGDGEPTSAEAERVLQGATALKAAIGGRQTPGAVAAINAASPTLQTVAQAYGRKPQT